MTTIQLGIWAGVGKVLPYFTQALQCCFPHTVSDHFPMDRKNVNVGDASHIFRGAPTGGPCCHPPLVGKYFAARAPCGAIDHWARWDTGQVGSEGSSSGGYAEVFLQKMS